MKRKINLRLLGISILAVLATAIGITFVYYSLFQKQVLNDLAVNAKLLKDTHYFESTNVDISKIALSTGITELRVTWINKDGSVLYDNDVSFEHLENHLNRPEVTVAFKDGVGETVRKSDTLNVDTFYYAVLLDNGTVLRVATNVHSIFAVFFSVAPIIILIIILIIGICAVISHLITKQIIYPIEVMADNLEDVDYDAPYVELEPLTKKLKSQHADVLAAAKARQDFTANVSHELKTPLTAISGYADLLQAGMIEETQKNHVYQEIKKNSNRLLSLINDIIRLSEFDRTGKNLAFEKLDLYSLAQESLENCKVSAKQRDIEITLEGQKCVVNANKHMMRELLENLVQNAIRYNNDGGRVRIVTEEREGKIMLVVKDNGIGIPASEQDRVFERFYRVDKSRSKATGGTGLGLAIVKHIAELHGASIMLDSSPGVGTSIAVVF